MTATPPVNTRQAWQYGLLGLPLAFVALPLYVVLPNHYATAFGVPLATLGAVLLGARLFDAVIDPLLGRWSDRLYARSLRAVLAFAGAAALLLAASFAGLFFPPVLRPGFLLPWATALLMLTYAAFSAVSIAHQSWGAMLGGDEAQRSRVVGWREGLGLVGVLAASLAPTLLGLGGTAALFAILLGIGWLAWAGGSARPAPPAGPAVPARNPVWQPFRQAAFRRLLAVFVLNGIASAIPATLVLFFVQDHLQAAPALEPAFLGTYFLCAALAIPLWLRAVSRFGLAPSWRAGMLLALASFAGVLGTGTGDVAVFLGICAVSGAALGADLALPGALLAGVIGEAGDRGRAEGAYFGWWNVATKLNLALAAGLSLPLLALAGYAPGTRSAPALHALVLAYGALPCLLKLLALAALQWLVIRPRAKEFS